LSDFIPDLNIQLPQTYWKYRRGIAIVCVLIGAIYAAGVVIAFAGWEVSDFPLVTFSVAFFLFLLVPVIIYMTGSNREDLEKIKGIIEVLKK
jgi:CHASE2 domain-containing sensor protein